MLNLFTLFAVPLLNKEVNGIQFPKSVMLTKLQLPGKIDLSQLEKIELLSSCNVDLLRALHGKFPDSRLDHVLPPEQNP